MHAVELIVLIEMILDSECCVVELLEGRVSCIRLHSDFSQIVLNNCFAVFRNCAPPPPSVLEIR